MTTQKEKAELFARLHKKGDPVVLFNIWDAGSAKAVAEAGAKALATGSWSVAAANGFADGENIPLDLAIENIRRIVEAVELPVSLDLEGGYSDSPETLTNTIASVIEAGAIGINFEDQRVGGEGLFSPEEQADRIAAIRAAADAKGVPLFINARTDVFLKTYPAAHTKAQVDEAVTRASAYAAAGASGFFVPGLRDPDLIRRVCDEVTLPVNVMVLPGAPSKQDLAALGVARISHGPGPYRKAMEFLKTAAAEVFSE